MRLANAPKVTATLGAVPTADGVCFTVWAPDKDRIDVLWESKKGETSVLPLHRNDRGEFVGGYPEVMPGDLYRYQVNGGSAFPDPASRYQPQGVHGPSEIVDPHRFPWTDAAWKGIDREDLIFYELHVGTFTPEGTFRGVTDRLRYLADLGITAIELMPLADFPGDRNWGYDGVALYAPARCYGRPDDLCRLVDAAHRLGVAVFVDVVYNHLGPDGNYLSQFSPYYFNSAQNAWGAALNFDSEGNEGVRDFFIQNALLWLQDYHMDGLRLDATHAIVDQSPHHFLQELTSRVYSSVKDRKVHVIAEDAQNRASLLMPAERGGDGLSAIWSDDFHHQVRRLTAGDQDGYFMDYDNRLTDLVSILEKGWLYCGQYSRFLKTARGTDPRECAPSQFVFYFQNHDQIGNRPIGDRISSRIDAATYRTITALLLSVPQIPLVFMGQEWSAESPFLYFTDHSPALGQLVREGRSREFSAFEGFQADTLPDPQSPETFRQSMLNWNEREEEPHRSMWVYYERLLRWRKSLIRGDHRSDVFDVSMPSDTSLMIKRLSDQEEPFYMVLQLSGAGTVEMAPFLPDAIPHTSKWDIQMTSEDKSFSPDPRPPLVRLSGPAPSIQFERPGMVLLLHHS